MLNAVYLINTLCCPDALTEVWFPIPMLCADGVLACNADKWLCMDYSQSCVQFSFSGSFSSEWVIPVTTALQSWTSPLSFLSTAANMLNSAQQWEFLYKLERRRNGKGERVHLPEIQGFWLWNNTCRLRQILWQQRKTVWILTACSEGVEMTPNIMSHEHSCSFYRFWESPSPNRITSLATKKDLFKPECNPAHCMTDSKETILNHWSIHSVEFSMICNETARSTGAV